MMTYSEKLDRYGNDEGQVLEMVEDDEFETREDADDHAASEYAKRVHQLLYNAPFALPVRAAHLVDRDLEVIEF